MTNINFNKTEAAKIADALKALDKTESVDVLARVATIVGDKVTTLDNAKRIAAETFGFKPTSAQGRVMTLALALGKRADSYIATAKDAEPKTRVGAMQLIGRLIAFTETGVDLDRARENVLAEYAKASAYEAAHNRMASLAEQAQKVFKEMRDAAKAESREFENLEALEEAVATFAALAPSKLK